MRAGRDGRLLASVLGALLGASALAACGPSRVDDAPAASDAESAQVEEWQQDAGASQDVGAPQGDLPSQEDAGVSQGADAQPASGGTAPPLEPVKRPSFCDRPRLDTVFQVFCAEDPPRVGNLNGLLDVLSLQPSPVVFEGGAFGSNLVVLLGHSTALSGHRVSSINPRALILGEGTILAFQRGVQQVELAATTRDTGELNFYLLTFEQVCNEAEGGCGSGDLYTPLVEEGWLRVAIHDDEELKNTAADCRQCHQRGRETPMLLMRELEGRWTHFFEVQGTSLPERPHPEPTGRDLVRDYLLAKGDEPYGTIPVDLIRNSLGLILQIAVDQVQPLIFDGDTIFYERWPQAPEDWPSEPRRSPTWDAAYQAFKRGEQLALPHYEPRPTDPEKLSRLTQAYQRYRAGEIGAEELPDLGDVFPDDPKTRAEIGLQNEPGATPPEALIQACGACHNDVLDQSLTRARFNVALSRLDQEEIDAAIERLGRPSQTPGAMPPPEARQLDPEARAGLIEYLKAGTRSAEEEAMLEHAARVGMAGGGRELSPQGTSAMFGP